MFFILSYAKRAVANVMLRSCVRQREEVLVQLRQRGWPILTFPFNYTPKSATIIGSKCRLLQGTPSLSSARGSPSLAALLSKFPTFCASRLWEIIALGVGTFWIGIAGRGAGPPILGIHD